MKNRFSKFLFALTILSLVIIAIVFVGGLMKNKPPLTKNNSSLNTVLGEQTEIFDSVPTTASSINVFMQNTIDNTKETVTQKVYEVEQTVLKSMEKEITDMTKSQVDGLKRQICTNWGVLSASPSISPKP